MPSKPRELLFPLTLALSLSGCTVIPDYKPVRLDSPSPMPADVQPCGPALTGKCVTLVRAEQWASKTGIQVKANEAYCATVRPGQIWFDADRQNTAPRGEAGSWLMKRYTKRHPGADFFSLMITTLPLAATPGAPLPTAMDLGSARPGAAYVSPVDGELVLYPNDAVGPPGAEAHWYKNNSGQIWVEIVRCTAAVAQASR